ncbi:MAG: arylsulfotransferase family protein [Salinibacter sp.]|uniref:arylsulfotransferase family protein n=1 Tax=Salinibacter sp. TaxID=2065818 RepID=UPI0035D4F0C5
MIARSFEKVAFVLSVAILTFVYGVAVGKWGWFPHDFLQQSLKEAQTVAAAVGWSDPGFLHPQRYDRAGTRRPQPERMQPGLTLITSKWKTGDGWMPMLKLVDRGGEVVHQWRIDPEGIFSSQVLDRQAPTAMWPNVHGSYLFADGDLLVNLEYIGMARLGACGDVRWTMAEGNHHSIARADDGTFWVSGVSRTPQAGSEMYPDGYPGLGGKKFWLDRVLQVSADGTLLADINVLDVLYENDLEHYISRYLEEEPYPTNAKGVPTDVTHINDVEPLSASMADEYPLFEAGDLAVSVRHLNLVFVFDPETLEVKWHASDPFLHQHDPDFVGNGWIGVFSNNNDLTSDGSMLGGSTIKFVRPHTSATEIRYPTAPRQPFYTPNGGKWQQLDNGNMLLTESAAGRVLEVDSTGQTVWEWVHSPYQGKVPSVQKATRYDLTREDVAAWGCASADTLSTSAQ